MNVFHAHPNNFVDQNIAHLNFNDNNHEDDNEDDNESFVFDDDDPDFADLPELLHDVDNDDDDEDDDDDDDDFDDLPELEIIPELVLATYGAIRERVDIAVLKSILEAAPAEETMGRSLLRLVKFALRCNRERQLQDGVLLLLIERDVECVKITDERGGFLLHAACECAAPYNVIEYLLELYNDAVRVPSEDGQLPLHYAVSRRNDCIKTLNRLLKEFPEAVRCTTRSDMLPVHVALNKNASVETCMTLLDFYPEAASQKASGNELALHIACRTNMALDIVKRLVELYPQGVHEKDDQGGLALHRACCGFNSTLGGVHPLYEPILLVHLLIACDCDECGAPVNVAQFLMDQNPDGASTIDGSGRIPLHYAARNGAFELSTRLLERFPGGIFVQDSEGKLPLHLACTNGSNDKLIRLLIDKNPEALKQQDKSQSVPLHYAASRRMAKTETLKMLLEKYPDGVHIQDENGRLPVHHACETHCLERIKLFVEADPYTLTKKTRIGSTPLKLACMSHRHVEIKKYLMEIQAVCLVEIRAAFNYATGDQCGFPDLVQANMWQFVNPGLYVPTRDELQVEEEDSDDDGDDDDFDSDDDSEFEDDDDDLPELQLRGQESDDSDDDLPVLDNREDSDSEGDDSDHDLSYADNGGPVHHHVFE